MTYARLDKLKEIKPYNIVGLDMEDDGEGNPYLYVLTYRKGNGNIGKKEYLVDQFPELIKYLFSRQWKRTILTGMNMGYDLYPLKEFGFNWKIVENSGGFISAFPTKEQSKELKFMGIKLVDVGNFTYKQPIKEVYRNMGYDDYEDIHILKESGLEKMKYACFTHARAAMIVLEEMQKQINNMMTNIEITPAMTAQKLHLRNFLPKTCQVFRKMEKEEMLFQYQAYFGGRTECFVLGMISDVVGIDINSSYPYEMRNKPFPDMEDYRIDHEVTLNRLYYLLDNEFEGQAHIEVKTNDDLITLLPFVKEGKLIFPKGQFVGNFTFPEIRRAIELGYEIIAVFKIGFAKRTKEPMFKGYVDEMYKLKMQKTFKLAAKLLMNSLYGKFGQKANENSGWVELDEDDVLFIQAGGKIEFEVQLIGEIMCKYIPESPIEERGFARKSIPLIAAYVTAYGRIHLFNTMKDIGFEYVYYCDTDSIYADSKAIMRAVETGKIKLDSKTLGAWDVEHTGVTLEVRGLKYYRLKENGKWNYTIKGVPKKNMANFWRERITAFYRPNKFRTSIRSKVKLNAWVRHTRRDMKPDHKRYFESNKVSFPFEME